MSTDTMQAPSQYSHSIPTSAASYPAVDERRYTNSQSPNVEDYYTNQAYYPSQNASDSPRYASRTETAPVTSASYTGTVTTIPYHIRHQSSGGGPDQYDGAPIPPPRTSSQQQGSSHASAGSSAAPLDARGATSRHARQHTTEKRQGGRTQHYPGDHVDSARDRPRDDTASAAASAARSRRKGPSSPDRPQRATSTRETASHQAGGPSQSRSSEMTMLPEPSLPPAPLAREYSEVINRVVVSDPQEDAERVQERIAEAQPAPVSSDVTPVGGEGVDDVARGPGPARRQDYSRSSSRRKDVQFGDYVLGQTLGEGEFGKVKLGWKKDGSTQVAIKLIRRETVASNPSRLPKIYREISILRELAHPNIVRLHEMVETERHIGIILEYASGGELFDYILNHRYLKDPAARRLFAQLVSGVGYLHKKGIVHRDLKLENLLLDQNRNIIITDFGFANTFNPADELSDEIEYNLQNKEFVKKFKLDRLDANGMRRGDLMQTSCGSPCYAAPELVVSDSLYTGRKVDVWSCGVILYAMLAGYLPFDDDPANPEGDNINLLYKYITTTPLTFPEYVTPHARDLLRRILVPDPRKRADLFEVARHSWLSEFHHVVSHVTSSTTNIADIAQSTVPSEPNDELVALNRSASVREPYKPSGTASPGVIRTRAAEGVVPEGDEGSSSSRRERSARHTLQPEYVPPQTHTARGPPPTAAAPAEPRNRAESHGPNIPLAPPLSLSKPLPQDPPRPPVSDKYYVPPTQQKFPPPVRPARDIPRSVSDSASAFGGVAPSAPTNLQANRPSTRGSLASVTGPVGTRSDLRLPSRGSYGQPVAPTVATMNAQGSVTQPTKTARGYNISGPIPQNSTHDSIGQPTTQPMPPPGTAPPPRTHHRRSSTLSGLGERLFGRSGSVMKKNDSERQKNGRKYPPTSMKEYPAEPQPRMSTDSKRSFSFGLGKKRSTDLESQMEKPTSARRFSLVPAAMSFKGLLGANKDESVADPAGTHQYGESFDPQIYTSRPTTGQEYLRQQVAGNEGHHDAVTPIRYNNFSRPPQAQNRYQAPAPPTPPMTQISNDVYGSTGVYVPPPPQERGQQHQRQASQPAAQFLTQYPEPGEDLPRPSMQQSRPARGVLTKPNRKFTDAYAYEYGVTHQGGSSGAVKKVQDFFRRRGRARADSGYR